MPLVNKTQKTEFDLKISTARSRKARMLGLLGTDELDGNTALHISPCSSVHTLGMRYSIDLIFLDKQNRIVHISEDIKPNKFASAGKDVHSIIECAAGTAVKLDIAVGDELQIESDNEHVPAANAVKTFLRWPVNIGMAILWAQLVLLSVQKWQLQNEPVSLGILVYNTLLLFMFLTRRESKQTSGKMLDWLIPIGTVAASMLLRPVATAFHAFALTGAIIQTIGICAVVLALGSLGRSFGVIPANRNVKISGAYSFVRHPLYAAEILFYTGFIIGHPSMRNFVLFLVIVLGQMWRAVSEEHLLLNDKKYKDYFSSVQYRFIPGIF